MSSEQKSFFLRHKILTAFLLVLVLAGAWLYSRRIGPYHHYTLDFVLPAPGQGAAPGQLQIGVAKRDITANLDLYDSWSDSNGNGKFDREVDPWVDKDGNGKFDGIWIAGFNTNRPAISVHDQQWARAIAFRNNGVTVAMVTIDAIGIFHNEFIRIREMIDPSLGVDHVMFSSTHCHEVPDTMKIWSGKTHLFGLDIPIFGYDNRYMETLQKQAAAAVEEAVRSLQPADMYCTKVKVGPEGFVRDSRKPEVMDPYMYLMRFTKPGTDETIATVVNWGNHPETLGGDNTAITSDFPHWLREGVENGVKEPNGVEGLGGMCLYFQGQIGGLMTQLHLEVPHRDGVRKFKEDSFEKAEALGENLAIVACQALRGPDVWKNENPVVAVAAKTGLAPMRGHYKYAIMLGLIHEGYYWGGRAKTEVNAIRIGDVLALAIPGEIYPEVVEGGIVALEGRDYPVEPVEVPPLREFMEQEARMAFVVGLANDEIGYIIPKSQWDTEPPFVYNDKDQYGEENSPGPEATGLLHRVSAELIQSVNEAASGVVTAQANP